MLKLLKEKYKVIVKQITIAFFFTAFIIFIGSILFGSKINKTLKIINNIAVVETTKTKKKNIKINIEKKVLSEYPSFGEIWAKLEIPAVDINVNVYQGDTLDILKYGVGHHSGSFFPGEGGTILIAGHNSKKDFMDLVKTKVGDEIIIKAVYGTYRYKIEKTEIKKAKQLNQELKLTQTKELLMLYTCYPVDSPGYKSSRFVVYASLVGEEHE